MPWKIIQAPIQALCRESQIAKGLQSSRPSFCANDASGPLLNLRALRVHQRGSALWAHPYGRERRLPLATPRVPRFIRRFDEFSILRRQDARQPPARCPHTLLADCRAPRSLKKFLSSTHRSASTDYMTAPLGALLLNRTVSETANS